MNDPVTILQEIRDGGYEASLISTYNAYLPFYEDVVLRHLMGGGVRHNVLMMDAAQVAIAIDQHPPRLAGRYYTLMPMKVSAAFHPKIIFMVGKNKGMLLVGSHNLTLSGFGYNREMTNLIHCDGKKDSAEVSVFNSAWKSIITWAMSQKDALPDHVLDMLRKVGKFAPWLSSSSDTELHECRILATETGKSTLWDQLLSFALPGPIRSVTICGAFFDSRLAFIKKVQEDLTPDQLTVGIDPTTVEYPADISLPGVNVVNCAQLGNSEKGVKHSGYLHAKSLLIRKADDETILAVGSANPSSPAWLAPVMTGNIEMMLVRRGNDAEAAARDMGLLEIPSMPPLSIEEWENAKLNWERKDDREMDGVARNIIIATAVDDNISFCLPGGSNPPTLSCTIVLTDGREVLRQASLTGCEYLLSVKEIIDQAILVSFVLDDVQVTGLVQHVKQIAGRSLTDLQRRLPEALSSLKTSMPDIENFIECIQKIISITDKASVDHKSQPHQRPPDRTEHVEQGGSALSIGLNELQVKESKKKARFHGADDLGYLLDILLYKLRDDSPLGIEVIVEEIDTKGRSEEEQIGADDEEEDTARSKNSNDRPAKAGKNPLSVCHSKVEALVTTACEKTKALVQNRITFGDFICIMAGILSTLRLLKGCDGKVPWIEPGQTAVPPKEFVRLFEKIVAVCFDGPKSIIHLSKQHESLSSIDELARLKGLIIWLGWESNISIKKKKPFNESREEYVERFQNNRLFVTLAQLISQDDDVIEEARQTIGMFSASATDWLNNVLNVEKLLFELRSNPDQLKDGCSAKHGDFGFNALCPECGVREVLPRDKNNHALASLGSAEARYVLPSANIRTIPFEQIYNAIS